MNVGQIALETQRLSLRQYALEDLAAILSLASDPSVREFVGNLPNSAEEAWARVLRCAGHWSLFGYGTMAVVEKDSGRIVGEIGAGHFHRGVDPRLDDLPEAGWFFEEEARGKGYAFEAMSALLEWIDVSICPSGVSCLIEPINIPSIKLSERLGFQLVDNVRYRDKPFKFFVR